MSKFRFDTRVVHFDSRVAARGDKFTRLLREQLFDSCPTVADYVERNTFVSRNDFFVQNNDAIIFAVYLLLHERDPVVFEDLFHRAEEFLLGVNERDINALCAGVWLHYEREAELFGVAVRGVGVSLRGNRLAPLVREK